MSLTKQATLVSRSTVLSLPP
jgi:hypothetical protein